MRHTATTTNCKVCGKEIKTTIERVADGRGKYCSRLCQFDGIRTSKETHCVICDKKIVRRASRISVKNYCSKKCRILGAKKFDYKRVVNWQNGKVGFSNGILGLAGRAISLDGYYVYNKKKVHRIMMENHIGRKLSPTEIVHHINGDKFDNRLENLKIMTRAEHNKIHKFFKGR